MYCSMINVIHHIKAIHFTVCAGNLDIIRHILIENIKTINMTYTMRSDLVIRLNINMSMLKVK